MDDHNALTTGHTSQELENARTKGKIVGWIQGAGAVLAVGLVLKFLGWLPVIAVGGIAAYIAYRLLFKRSEE